MSCLCMTALAISHHITRNPHFSAKSVYNFLLLNLCISLHEQCIFECIFYIKLLFYQYGLQGHAELVN